MYSINKAIEEGLLTSGEYKEFNPRPGQTGTKTLKREPCWQKYRK